MTWNSSDAFMHKCKLNYVDFQSALLKTTLRGIVHLYKELHYYYFYFAEGCSCTVRSTFPALSLRLHVQ